MAAKRDLVPMVPLREVEPLYDTLDLLQERIQELEGNRAGLFPEDSGWRRFGGEGDREFSREFLRTLAGESRRYYLKNPLINRAVSLQAFYVFGQGMDIGAHHPVVNDVVQSFMDDPKNKAELTGHQARALKEISLQVEGNTFLALFVERVTGRVRVRSIPPDEIDEIRCNPEDAKDPWLYKRTWPAPRPSTGMRSAWYPDWRHAPTTRPPAEGDVPIEWDTPVYHVRVGGLPEMRFGVPETYAALDWANAHKSILEDEATRSRALARFVLKMTTKGGAAGAAAARAKLAAAQTAARTDPAAVSPGSTFIASEGVSLEATKMAGAFPPTDHHRPFMLQVAAAMGLPETFFGNADVSNLATAKTLDRPTELKFADRRTLWADVFGDLLHFQIDQSARAPRGLLHTGARVVRDALGEESVVLGIDPATGEPIHRGVDVSFPPILEHSISEQVDAIVRAATLDGKVQAGTIDVKLVARLLLQALGVDKIDEVLAAQFPEDADDG